ncbi:hypothetical protein ACSLPA_33120, partial [Escherichia coli]
AWIRLIALLVSGCLYARPDVAIRYFCFQVVVLKVQFFVVTVQQYIAILSKENCRKFLMQQIQKK